MFSLDNLEYSSIDFDALMNSLCNLNLNRNRISKTGWSDELFHQNYVQPLIDESLTEPDMDTRKQWAVAMLDFYATGKTIDTRTRRGKTPSRLHATEIMKYFLLTWTIDGKPNKKKLDDLRLSFFFNVKFDSGR